MNEKDVPTYPITDWIPTHATVDQEKYPQPGDPNPAVRLAVVIRGWRQDEVDHGQRRQTGALPLGNDPNVLIPRFGWVRNGCSGRWCSIACKTGWICISLMSNSGKSQLMMTETHRCLDRHASRSRFQAAGFRRRLFVDQLARRPQPHLSVSLRQAEPTERPRQDGGAAYPWRLGSREHRWRRRAAGHRLLLGQRRRLAAAQRIRRRAERPELPSHLESRMAPTWPTSIPRTRSIMWTISPR